MGEMTEYLIRRLVTAIPLLFVIILLVFVFTHLHPGDPVRIKLGEKASPQAVQAMRERLHLDDPLPLQFVSYLGELIQGDLGESIYSDGRPITADIGVHLPATIELALSAMILATFVGVTLGVLSAVRRGKSIDYLSMTVSLFGVSIPIFWLGLLLILIFGRMLPTGGNLSPEISIERITGFVLIDATIAGHGADAVLHLILPAVTLATVPMAIIARITRSSMLEVLGMDYVRTAKAKGVAPDDVVMKHAFRNALIPIVTVVGLQFGYLLGGAVLTETIFDWPGMGKWIVDAVSRLDYKVVNAGVLILATTFVLVNLVVDIAYAMIDPRIRYGRT
jgi:peptide/nickel transport system permease protein